ARQVGDGGRGHGTGQQHVDTRGRQARSQRGLQHVAGNPGVLADHDSGTPLALVLAGQHLAGGVAQAQGKFGIDGWTAYFTTDTIGAEILPIAHSETPCSTAFQTSRASRIAATSWTRTTFAPRATQARAADRLPIRR